jgi:hypothetical protein
MRNSAMNKWKSFKHQFEAKTLLDYIIFKKLKINLKSKFFSSNSSTFNWSIDQLLIWKFSKNSENLTLNIHVSTL